MKIAYLIAASGDYGHLRRLVDALDDGHARIFVHIDAKSPMPEGLSGRPAVTFVPRVEVWWGGFSQVRATLNMMRAAAAEGFDYYAFISGGDYPVRPVQFLYDTLARGGEYISATEGFQSHKPARRVKFYYFDGFNRRKPGLRRLFFRGLELVLRQAAVKRSYPFAQVWTGGSWWVLSDPCVRYILDYVDGNPRYVRFFRTALCPDEAFFQTIIGNSPFAGDVRGCLTYADWSAQRSGPAFIGMEHLPQFAPGVKMANGYEPFFARKFTDASAPVVEAIDRMCGRV